MSEKDLTALAAIIEELGRAMLLKSETEERITDYQTRIKDALGDNDTGLVNGEPVIRWANVTSRRFDQTLAKARIPHELLDQCYTETVTRPFRFIA